MKVKVITKFKDKYTFVWHEINDNMIVDEKRYKEIKNLVKVVEKDVSVKKTSSKTRKANFNK